VCDIHQQSAVATQSEIKPLWGEGGVSLSAKLPDGLSGPLILLFKDVKQQGCEFDHSHPHRAEV